MSGAKLADSAVDREILITENMGLVRLTLMPFALKGVHASRLEKTVVHSLCRDGTVELLLFSPKTADQVHIAIIGVYMLYPP